MRRLIQMTAMVAAFAALLLIGCNKSTEKTPAETPVAKVDPAAGKRPNVIVILVDTLRVDFVGTFGGKYSTPVIDMLAGTGVAFEKTYAPCSWTVPSIASLFTGMYPQTHGLTNGVAAHINIFKQQRLPESYDTLAEGFKSAGYTTFGITANAHLDEQYGYNAGFDHFKMFQFQDGSVIEDTATEWQPLIQQAAEKTGYFIYLHWLDPHHPYDPREPFISKIRPDYMKQVGRLLDVVTPEALLSQGYFKEYPDKLNVLRDLYGGEVEWSDASLGRVLKMLPEVGDSVICVVADHGEAFAEHDSMSHGFDLYQETVHVPMIFLFPDKKAQGKRIKEPVSLVDIPVTLLSYAGIKVPKDMEGTNLMPVIDGTAPIPERKIWSHLDKNDQVLWHAVFDGKYKFMEHLPSKEEIEQAKEAGTKTSEEYYLFDLEADPGEKKNLVKSLPAKAAELKELLEAEMSKKPLVQPETVENDMDEELRQKFKSVGYL